MSLAHLRTLVWLRSRIARNQFTRGKTWVAVLGIIMRVFLAIGAVALSVGGFLVGLLLLDEAPRWVLWAVWGGTTMMFLFLWMITVLSEVQRSEAIDIRRLMHLPVSLQQIFIINYFASLFTPSLILAVPASGALALGLVLSRGPHMAWLLAVLFAFFFVLTAWTYCLRGWLVNLMTNKRRRRAIIMGMTAAVILVGQLPNVVFNSPLSRKYLRNQGRQAADAVERVPLAVTRILAAVQAVPLWKIALPLAATGTALGGLGLLRAYRVTVSFYTAASTRRPRKRRRAEAGRRARRSMVLRRLPFAPEPVSAMAMAFLRSNLRAPEIRMALLMPVVMGLIFGMVFLGRSGGNMPEAFKALPTLGVMALSALALSQFIFNIFGFDREAFRTLLLLPTDGRRMLLAKNLSLLPFPMGIGGLLLVLVTLLLRLPPWTFLASALQLLATCLLLCIPGNFASTRVPFRLPGATMHRPKVPTPVILLVLLFQLTIPVILLPVAIPPLLGMVVTMYHPLPGELVNLAGSTGVLLVAMFVYGLTLAPAGRYFQNRSLDILKAVTEEGA